MAALRESWNSTTRFVSTREQGNRNINLNQLHAVSRTHQGRLREPSVKTLRSSLSAEFWRHRVLSSRTQHRPLCRHQSEENGKKLSKYFISSSGDRTPNQSVLQLHFVRLSHDRPLTDIHTNAARRCVNIIINLYNGNGRQRTRKGAQF